jgi:hypothetical protein
VQARSELLGLYKCTTNKQGEVTRRCELHSTLVQAKRPSIYILVTNVEVNANFRATFETRCREENPDIKHCQIIGLDELELAHDGARVRAIVFPTIFEDPNSTCVYESIVCIHGSTQLCRAGCTSPVRKSTYEK